MSLYKKMMLSFSEEDRDVYDKIKQNHKGSKFIVNAIRFYIEKCPQLLTEEIHVQTVRQEIDLELKVKSIVDAYLRQLNISADTKAVEVEQEEVSDAELLGAASSFDFD